VEAVREDRCQALALAPRYDSLCNWHPMGCLQVWAVCRGAGVGLAHLAGL